MTTTHYLAANCYQLWTKQAAYRALEIAHREFVTISIDTLKFIAPTRQGDLLEVTGKVVFTMPTLHVQK